jgi:dTDP-4-amino-4,6-dideoxygalactose transaminase
VVLRAKLKRLADWNEKRRAAARRYDELLGDDDRITLPATAPGNEHVWHLYVVRVQDRDRVMQALIDGGVGASVHYPVPIHLQGAFAHLGHERGTFPATEALADTMLSLPIYPHLSEEQSSAVADRLKAAL